MEGPMYTLPLERNDELTLNEQIGRYTESDVTCMVCGQNTVKKRVHFDQYPKFLLLETNHFLQPSQLSETILLTDPVSQ